MGLTLTVLGSCGSYPERGRACSGYLLRGAGTAVLLDAGSGTLANLQKHIDISELDAVIISHEHPDHWIDTTGLHVAAKYYLRMDRLPIYGPASVRDAMYYSDEPFAWEVVGDGDRVTIGGLTATFSRTDHPVETLAVRIDGDGKSIAYSADTGPGWSFSALGDGIDLALCEATFAPEHEGVAQHLSARQAGEMSRAAGVGRLVLTHVEPGTDLAQSRQLGQAAFGGPLEVAVEDMEFEL